MNPTTLIALYFCVGLTCGALVYRKSEPGAAAAASALAAVLVWPLWGPFALAAPSQSARGPLAERVARALEPVTAVTSSSSADTVLRRSETTTLLRQVAAAERRLGELDAQLSALQAEAARPRAEGFEALARGQIRATSVAQLEALRTREHRALLDLAELCELLRTQHLLSRFGNPSRANELRDELWARVQALSELGELEA